MPHLTLQYTSNLSQFRAVPCLQRLNATLIASGHFDPMDIKSRAVRHDEFVIGTQVEGQAFIHVTLAILSGRSPEIKQQLSASLLETLREHFTAAALPPLQLCAEIVDIDRASYAKAKTHT